MYRSRIAAFVIALCCTLSALPQPNVLGRAFPLTNTRYGERSGPLFAPTANASFTLFGAADQKLVLMTSSDDGVFVVWFEVRDMQKTYHAGVRSPLGDWKEIVLPVQMPPIAAAAGGGQFMLVMPRGDAPYHDELGVLRWTAALEPIGGEISIRDTFEYFDDAAGSIVAGWTGSAFVIVGVGRLPIQTDVGNDLAAILISPSGTLGAPKLIYDRGMGSYNSHPFRNVSFASHGDTFVLAWKAYALGGLRALRVSADLSASESIEVASWERLIESVGGVAWDGDGFVVVWKDRTSLYTRRIPAKGALEPQASVLPGVSVLDITRVSIAEGGAVVPVPGGIAMFWKQSGELRQSVVRSGMATPAPTSFEYAPQRFASFGSAIAYASISPQGAEPHYGATRVMMNIGDVTLPETPDAPRLNATLALDGNAVLTWTAPRQKTNGYRVEQRSSDGNWLEVERWISAADARFLSIPVGSATSFRIRAWNDAGVSAYSNIALPASPIRRAIRH